MSTEQSSKNVGTSVLYIGFGACTSLAKVLRNMITSVKYAYLEYGESHYKNYLKGAKGHRFKKEANFLKVTIDKKQSDIERMAVTKTDIAIVEKMSRRLNIDYFLGRRPDNIQQLVEKKYLYEGELTSHEEKLVRAFTCRDEKGKIIMDAENPKLPYISDSEYMLMIATKDLDKWEFITRELEAHSYKVPFSERLKHAKQKMYLNKKERQKTPRKTKERDVLL